MGKIAKIDELNIIKSIAANNVDARVAILQDLHNLSMATNNNVSSETTEKNTEVIADNTEQVKEHSEKMSKAAIEAQNSADKITAAGKNISSASSQVVTAEGSLRQSTKTLTYSVTNAANTINNVIGYAQYLMIFLFILLCFFKVSSISFEILGNSPVS